MDPIIDGAQQLELTYEEKQKKQNKESFILAANMFINFYGNISKRHNTIKDPATRYALFVDKLCLSIDAGLALLTTKMDELDIEPELKIKVEDSSAKLQEELNSLMSWITQPVYSPDHPYGGQIMKAASCDFGSK